MDKDIDVEPLAETENFMVYKTEDEEGETVYHVEVFNITLHFYQEEWDEFAALIHAIPLKD
jgi:hypothetical protein